MQRISEIILMKSSKIAIRENLDPRKFSTIRYYDLKVPLMMLEHANLYTEIALGHDITFPVTYQHPIFLFLEWQNYY